MVAVGVATTWAAVMEVDSVAALEVDTEVVMITSAVDSVADMEVAMEDLTMVTT